MDESTPQLELVQRLKEVLVLYATGDQSIDKEEYKKLRRLVLLDPYLKPRVPRIVRDCADLGEFWTIIKRMFSTYAERRSYLRSEFLPLLTQLEELLQSPGTDVMSAALAKVDWEHVQDGWRKALNRLHADPEGAVTAARTLIETVCKHILDAKSIPYRDRDDLQNLYDAAAKSMNLAPTSTTEPAFRQILTGCYSVINGVSAIRNKNSDAHGKGNR